MHVSACIRHAIPYEKPGARAQSKEESESHFEALHIVMPTLTLGDVLLTWKLDPRIVSVVVCKTSPYPSGCVCVSVYVCVCVCGELDAKRERRVEFQQEDEMSEEKRL